MPITVKNVLQLNSFKTVKLVAGFKGISRKVNNASLMEVPDIFPYVEANNLLITTLYPIYDNKDAIQELIPKLASQGLAGICIKPGRYIEEIPEIMIQQANNLQFPILQLPQDANLSDLVNDILELSLDKHISTLEFRNYVHDKLMDLFLKGADIKTLVESLSNIVEFPVFLLDGELNIICTSKDIDVENISVIANKNISNIHADDIKVVINGKECTKDSCIIYSINAGNTCFGYIILLKGQANGENLIVAVQQAALLIASVFHKNSAVLEKEKNFQDAFIRDILQGKVKSQIDAIKKAKVFGWNLEFPQVIIVIKVLNSDETNKKTVYENIISSSLVEKIFFKRLSIFTGNIKTVYLDDSLVVFINAIFINNIKQYCIDIGNVIVNELKKETDVGIGISKLIEDIDRFPIAYSEAHNSLSVGAILNRGSFVSHYDEYRIFNILKEIKDEDVLREYIESKLGEIIKYDNKNDLNLMNTLRVIIEVNFNMKKAAKKLFIHYNTLRYRVEKLKELGIQIENGFEMGEIVLAYNGYLWLKAKGKLDM
ncbi:PucR family transcriptional regulator [Sporosalibacterium faouarense]|uniref:PucR family transcriptional regulator n=1 Tax=Sporosalibacterium faouarense TaxID=516123 RepID=UPI00141C9414|nr:PucR family transcriptional regulator [Sporosalibacterium faouarense]MTI47426.1 PucR family transcriptional regulator [Bacillota bacterium]